jgi:hypothetical protein
MHLVQEILTSGGPYNFYILQKNYRWQKDNCKKEKESAVQKNMSEQTLGNEYFLTISRSGANWQEKKEEEKPKFSNFLSQD